MLKSKLGKCLAAGAVIAGVSTVNTMAQLTVSPASIYSGVEDAFDAAALLGVAAAAVIFVVRFIKKGLRVA